MNGNDFEEKLLLNSLGNDHHNHHHRLLNNCIHSHSQYNYRTQYKQPQFEEQNYQRLMNHHRRRQQQQLNCEQPWNKIDQVASVVSMSAEEDLLDNFELELFDGEQPDIVDSNTHNVDAASPDSTGNMSGKFPDAPVLSKLPRRITSDSNQEDAKAKTLPINNAQSQQAKQHRQQTKQRKSSPSRGKANAGDEDNDKQASESRARIEVPTTVDILCGQSRVCASHPGNRIFQTVLEDFAHKYDTATSKQEKMQMTKAVVTIIHDSKGRFLKHKNEMWEEISIVTARDKVSHALRNKVASWKKQRQQQQQQQHDQQRHSLSPRSGRSSISRSSRSSRQHRRSGSNSPDNIHPISFDGNDVSSSGVVNGLIQAQQELFAQSMGSPETDNHNNSHHVDNNTPLSLYHHQSQNTTPFIRHF